MKTSLLFGLCLFLSLGLSSQIKFEPGYILTDKNERIECLIKNMDWKNSPKSIEYKLSENSEIKFLDISEFNEFEIYNESKYKKFEVEIDRDEFTDERNQISKNSNPKFNKEILLMKCLIEGDANLYVYKESNTDKFFYNINKNQVKQLIYKRYIKLTYKVGQLMDEHYDVNKSMVIYTNYEYKNQLLNDLKCEGISKKVSNNLNTIKKSYFISSISTMHVKRVRPSIIQKKSNNNSFNLYVQGGTSCSTFKMNNSGNPYYPIDIDFGSKFSYRFGIETEIIAPYKKNKWAISFSPAYVNYSTEKQIEYLELNIIPRQAFVTVEYNQIEIPISLKYYMHLSSMSKIHINASVITGYHLTLQSTLTKPSSMISFPIPKV